MILPGQITEFLSPRHTEKVRALLICHFLSKKTFYSAENGAANAISGEDEAANAF